MLVSDILRSVNAAAGASIVNFAAAENVQAGDLISVGVSNNNAYWANDPNFVLQPWRPLYQPTVGYNVAGGTAITKSSLSTVSSAVGGFYIPQPQMVATLSNGNIVSVWGNSGSPYNNTFTIYTVAAATGLTIVQSTDFAPGTAGSLFPPQVCALSGGGFAVVYQDNAGHVAVASFDNTGTSTGTASISDTPATAMLQIVALAGGGFSISYRTSTKVRYATYTATCTVATAAFDVTTFPTGIFQPIAALSGGGYVGVNCTAAGGSSGSPAFTIYNNSGGTVVTATNTTLPSYNFYGGVVGLTGGGFAIFSTFCGSSSPGGLQVAVYNSSGVQQGSNIVLELNSQQVVTAGMVKSSGGSLFISWLNVTSTFYKIAKIAANGTLTKTVTTTLTGSSGGNTNSMIPDTADGVLLFAAATSTIAFDSGLNSSYGNLTSAQNVAQCAAGIAFSNANFATNQYYFLISSISGATALQNVYAVSVPATQFIGVATANASASAPVSTQVTANIPVTTRLTFAAKYQLGQVKLLSNTVTLPPIQMVPTNIN